MTHLYFVLSTEGALKFDMSRPDHVSVKIVESSASRGAKATRTSNGADKKPDGKSAGKAKHSIAGRVGKIELSGPTGSITSSVNRQESYV